MEGADKYPPLADNHSLAKDWAESLLQDCSKDRMLAISKQFLIPNTNTLTKEPLYHAVFDHMLTIPDCIQCGGDCDPTKHVFHCNEPPAHLTANTREMRSANNINSPSRVTSNSNLPGDRPAHRGPSAPLPEGQSQGPGSSRGPPPPAPMSFGLVTGGRRVAVSNSVALTALQED